MEKEKMPDSLPEEFHRIHPSVKVGEGARISPTAVIEEGCSIGANCFIGHNTIMRPFTIIGPNTKIGHLCVFEGDSYIGSDCVIQSQSHITRGAKIEAKVFIGPGFIGVNDRTMTHLRHDVTPFVQTPFIIEYGARIGSGAILLPGVVVGRNARVGCGSVVTRNVPENMEVWGVPAIARRTVPVEERLQ